MNIQDAQNLAQSVLSGSVLGPHLERVEVIEAVHVDGEPQYEVSAYLRSSTPQNTGWDFSKAQLALIEAFREKGETRFPLLRTRRLHDRYPEEFYIRHRASQQ